jgi:hypothetical protein
MSLAALTAVLMLVSCSHQKKESREDLRSDLTAATSLATESESFLVYVLQGRSTQSYAEGHLSYLADEAQHNAEDLQKAAPESGLETQFKQCQRQLNLLQGEIQAASRAKADAQSLQRVKREIESTRQRFAELQASL